MFQTPISSRSASTGATPGPTVYTVDATHQAAQPPLVSLIITTYNLERYLPRTLESALQQTLHNIEIIAVDDGSADRSPQLLDQYASQDPRLQVLHAAHGGPVAARNAGIAAAAGQYLGFLDGDDMLEPRFLESLYKAGRQCNADISKGETLITYFDGTSERIQRNQAIRASGSKLYFFGYWWTALYHRRLFEQHGLRFAAGNLYNEDLLFQNEALMHCSSLALVDDVHYLYLKRQPGTTFGAPSNPAKLRCGAQVYMQILDNLKCYQPTLDRPGILYVQKACLKNLLNLARAARELGYGDDDVRFCLGLANDFLTSCLFQEEFIKKVVPGIFDAQPP